MKECADCSHALCKQLVELTSPTSLAISTGSVGQISDISSSSGGGRTPILLSQQVTVPSHSGSSSLSGSTPSEPEGSGNENGNDNCGIPKGTSSKGSCSTSIPMVVLERETFDIDAHQKFPSSARPPPPAPGCAPQSILGDGVNSNGGAAPSGRAPFAPMGPELGMVLLLEMASIVQVVEQNQRACLEAIQVCSLVISLI